jgi:hypothetical protein
MKKVRQFRLHTMRNEWFNFFNFFMVKKYWKYYFTRNQPKN